MRRAERLRRGIFDRIFFPFCFCFSVFFFFFFFFGVCARVVVVVVRVVGLEVRLVSGGAWCFG